MRGDDEMVEVVSQAGAAPFNWRRPDRYRAPLAQDPAESKSVLAIAGRFLHPGETCATVAAWATEEGYLTRRGNG
ncbi:MAG TPA: hypothetical protein VNF71_07290 [Acidimicrobiales bacterium]|nr:hypothetical protein [Acidimicrobiales bacterium]